MQHVQKCAERQLKPAPKRPKNTHKCPKFIAISLVVHKTLPQKTGRRFSAYATWLQLFVMGDGRGVFVGVLCPGPLAPDIRPARAPISSPVGASIRRAFILVFRWHLRIRRRGECLWCRDEKKAPGVSEIARRRARMAAGHRARDQKGKRV